jgi:RNA polymerase sigma-70 factor (ECF subfamily)
MLSFASSSESEITDTRDLPSPASEPAPFSRIGQKMALDPARFQRLVTGQLDFVWRCLRRFGVPAADADDAAQQVFLVVHEKLAGVPEDKERAFLVATTARVAANARRSIRRRLTAYEHLADLPDEPSPMQEQLAEQYRARALLDRVMAELPDDLREVFVLFEIEEFSIQEIATLLEVPLGTVGSRLRRARQAFQDKVSRYKTKAEFRLGVQR